jgi:hypothetical protein
MDFMHVSGEEVRAAQMLTTATLASFFVVGFVPGLRAYAGRIRTAIAIGYLVAVVVFIVYLLVR